MTHHQPFLLFLRSRLLYPCILAVLVILAQSAISGNIASAASNSPSRAHALPTQAAMHSPSTEIKPATLAWLTTHPCLAHDSPSPDTGTCHALPSGDARHALLPAK
ncbi:MAG: hypothetical protein ABI413_13695 [Ktedonobacteraceae bacterium]